jgi:hypothetical protein
MTPISEIKAALRRCKSMGADSPYRRQYDAHPLAASISNYSAVIDAEIGKPNPDWVSVLCWVHAMSKWINGYCDEHKIAGDDAAKYWLHQFIEPASQVANMEKVSG